MREVNNNCEGKGELQGLWAWRGFGEVAGVLLGLGFLSQAGGQ